MQARKDNSVSGVDVSHYQGTIDWVKVKASGRAFALIKATEGQDVIDDILQVNVTGAKAAGLAVGIYHYSRAESITEAKQEAAFFINVLESIGGVSMLNIPPILDFEEDITHPEQLPAICHMWLDTVEQKYGMKPMIYTYPWFADTYLSDSSFGAYKLWYSYFGDGNPTDAGAWKEWEFWQFSKRGTVPGINAPVDENYYAGEEWTLLYQLKPEDANAMIERWVAHEYDLASDADKAERHRLANELRKASGQAEQPPK